MLGRAVLHSQVHAQAHKEGVDDACTVALVLGSRVAPAPVGGYAGEQTTERSLNPAKVGGPELPSHDNLGNHLRSPVREQSAEQSTVQPQAHFPDWVPQPVDPLAILVTKVQKREIAGLEQQRLRRHVVHVKSGRIRMRVP